MILDKVHEIQEKIEKIKSIAPFSSFMIIDLSLTIGDPLNIRHSICLKMIMNAHSTAVMAKIGRVVGNTMTNVRAGNLKLIGRATYLI